MKLIETNPHIRKLIRQGEHQQLDFKFAITDSKKIARTLVAFANTDGGKLLIGVKDNGSIAGAVPDEEFYMVQAAAEMYSKPPIEFQTRSWDMDGKIVLEITIPKSKHRPHSAPTENGEWKVYIRVKDQNLLANSILLKVWKLQEKSQATFIQYSEKETILIDYLKEHESITLSRYVTLAHILRKTAEDVLVNLILLEVIEIVFTDKGILYKLKKNKIMNYEL